jgi:apolipoprotein N-acyltransferase
VNISEDAWFGDSLAPHQRVQMAQMRAQELARPMLRSANSGPSTYIDHLGNVQSSTQQFAKEVMLVSVFPRTGLTPFARFGLWIVWLSMLCLFVVAVSIRKLNEDAS